MSPIALIMMISAEVIISAFTFYFLYKALTVPPRAEPDSYSDND